MSDSACPDIGKGWGFRPKRSLASRWPRHIFYFSFDVAYGSAMIHSSYWSSCGAFGPDDWSGDGETQCDTLQSPLQSEDAMFPPARLVTEIAKAQPHLA
jgi:hypothetical protein